MRTTLRTGIGPLAIGATIGAVLAAANVYTGLTTAYIDGGAIPAAILGFGLLRAGASRSDLVSRLNIVQATASSAAVMVGVVGLAGPRPALYSLGHEVSPWLLLAWGVALGVLGIVLAHALRERLVEREALPFPTSIGTSEVIRALTDRAGEGRRRAIVLALATAGAGLIAFAQQSGEWLPSAIALPLAFAGVEASLGVGLAPLVIATGALLGLRTAWAMAGSGVVVWAWLVPTLQARGLIASGEFADAITWLMWPAVGLLLGDGVHALLERAGAWGRSWRDLALLVRTRQRGHAPAMAAVAIASAAIVGLGHFVLGVPVLLALAALVLATVLSAMIGRAAGETDVAPVGAAGALGQMVVGAHGPIASLVGGSIPCGLASQTAQGLWAFATTHLLRAQVRPVVVAQLVGVVVGACVAVPVYVLLVSRHGIGTEAMPAWAAIAWAATARAVQAGSAAPPGAMPAAIAAFGLAVLAAWRRRRRPDSRVPSPTAIAIGALTPSSFSFAVLFGAVVMAGWTRRAPASAVTHGATVAAGCIAGEALIGITLALLGP